MGHFPAAEPQRDLDLVTVLQELENTAHFDIVIIGISVRTELDFLDLDYLLFLAGFRLTLLGLVFELAEVHDLADRRCCIWRNFNQIQTSFLGHFHSTIRRYDADVFAICTNQADVSATYSFVDAGAGFSLRRRVVWSASDDVCPLIVEQL